MPSENGNANGTTNDESNGHQNDRGITIKTKSIPVQSSGSMGSPTTFSSSLKRNVSQGNLINSQIKEAKVRVIYTGGTIGMVRNEQNGEFYKFFLLKPDPNKSCFNSSSTDSQRTH